MLKKKKDSLQPQIDELNALLALDLPYNKREMVKKELKLLRSGEKGEKDSAYYIDFYWRNSKDWAILHDLRLEDAGNVAQIDHLLINRFLEFFVIESKHYSQSIRISQSGEFSFFFNGRTQAIPSPVEQNKRHVFFLEQYLAKQAFMPKRIWVNIEPLFESIVLVSPTSQIIRPSPAIFDTSMVVKSDMLKATLEKRSSILSNLDRLAGIVRQNTLQGIARSLALRHCPARIDYRKKFGIRPEAIPSTTVSDRAASSPPDRKAEQRRSPETGRYFCARCKKGVSEKVARFCFQHKARFSGAVYCFGCQRVVSA